MFFPFHAHFFFFSSYLCGQNTTTMEKFFNTAGPQIPNDNYTIAPLARFNLDEILSLIRQQRYFVLHAPRQTGKTSCMLALRDYRIVLSNQDIVTGGSAFNIKAESLRLGNFSKDEIRELYMQHTRETGQQWDEACFPMVWEASEGQPWLVNALAHEVTYKMKNSDSWIQKFYYAEAGPQLLLQAFLQRIVNGGGYIDREYGLGRKRTDLLIRKPLTDGYGGPVQRVVLELKIKRGSLDSVIESGLEQTWQYMDTVGSVDEGHLIIFDRTKEKSWDERIWHKLCQFNGHDIMVWGM